MPLPVLKSTYAVTTADLLRFGGQVEMEWARHLGEETALDIGRAFTAPLLAGLAEANCTTDVQIPGSMSAAEAFDTVNRHFEQHAVRCERWMFPQPMASGSGQMIIELLVNHGFERRDVNLLHLVAPVMATVPPIADLKIIPARAGMQLLTKLAEEWNCAPLVDAAMLHLDDSHYDMLLALKGGAAVGCVGVLTIGEMGAIRQFYVSDSHRGLGIGRLLLQRAVEICMRSLLRHVMVCSEIESGPAIKLLDQIGFQTIGQLSWYQRADAMAAAVGF